MNPANFVVIPQSLVRKSIVLRFVYNGGGGGGLSYQVG